MKRKQFIREIEAQGCEFCRSGGNHDIYQNPATQKISAVPRHSEIKDLTCKLIRKQLGLPPRR